MQSSLLLCFDKGECRNGDYSFYYSTNIKGEAKKRFFTRFASIKFLQCVTLILTTVSVLLLYSLIKGHTACQFWITLCIENRYSLQYIRN